LIPFRVKDFKTSVVGSDLELKVSDPDQAYGILNNKN
jgi:hypothetical protein